MLEEQCTHQHRCESSQHASRTIGDGIQFYNHRRPDQALGTCMPVQVFNLAAGVWERLHFTMLARLRKHDRIDC